MKGVCARTYWVNADSIPADELKKAKMRLRKAPRKKGGMGSKREKAVKAEAAIKSLNDLAKVVRKK